MSDASIKTESAAPTAPKAKFQLPVHFIKSTCFRVVHANGVWYGGDNQGNLHMTFFNERVAIPKMVVVNLDERGVVMGEDESKRETKKGVVREMEVDIVLSLQVASELYRTLGENIRAIQDAQKHTPVESLKALQEIIKSK